MNALLSKIQLSHYVLVKIKIFGYFVCLMVLGPIKEDFEQETIAFSSVFKKIFHRYIILLY